MAPVNNVDITVMRASGSQWMATAGAVIPEIGALLVRTE